MSRSLTRGSHSSVDVESWLKRHWLKLGDDAVAGWWFEGLLRLGEIVLFFELNRIYKFWYGKEPECPVEDIRKAVQSLEKVPEGNDALRKKWELVSRHLNSYEAKLVEDGLLQAGALTGPQGSEGV